MAKVDAKTIEEFKKVLEKDPHSKIFASLADAYREQGDLILAERLALSGIQRHPQYVSGFVVLGRVLIDQEKPEEALKVLRRAVEIDPQNLLAHHLVGSIHLQMNDTKEALKSFKMVLFLNPQSEKARKAVQKLENLTADEYEEDVFEYRHFSQDRPIEKSVESSSKKIEPVQSTPRELEKELDRLLSLVDALIVRNALERAHETLLKAHALAPQHPEVLKRFELLEDEAPEEHPQDLSPLKSREKQIFDRKKDLLEGLLQRVKSVQSPQI